MFLCGFKGYKAVDCGDYEKNKDKHPSNNKRSPQIKRSPSSPQKSQMKKL
jgi:hypothetical protein